MTYNFPVAFEPTDKIIQDRINQIPQECPLCHKHTSMALSYWQETSPEMYSPRVSYELKGHCIRCGIDWRFEIIKRGFG